MLAAIALAVTAGCSGGDERQTSTAPPFPDSPTLRGGLKEACEEVRDAKRVAPLCPTWLPPAGDGFDQYRGYSVSQVDFERGKRCQYLTQLGYSGDGAGTDLPFHMLFGGRCDPWPMAVSRRRWPARPGRGRKAVAGRLRLVNLVRVPGRSTAKVVRPKVVGRSAINGNRAQILWFAPLARGGIHGGHYGVIWNYRGAGYALTLHYNRGDATLMRGADAAPPRAAERRALLMTARGMAELPDTPTAGTVTGLARVASSSGASGP